MTAAGGEGVDRDLGVRHGTGALWGRGGLSSASSEGSSAPDYANNSLVNNNTNADERGLGMVEMRVVRS
jgi:SLT domain-containing protein